MYYRYMNNNNNFKKQVIFIFSQDLQTTFSPTILEQQNIIPICIKDQKTYFYSNENQLFNKNDQNVYIKVAEPIRGIKFYPITDYLFQGVYDRNTDIHITTDRVVIKKQSLTVKNINIQEKTYNDIKSFLRIFCDLNIFSTKDESAIIHTQFMEEQIGVRVSLFPSEQDSLISLRFIYQTPILINKQEINKDLVCFLEHNQLIVIGAVTGRGKTTLMYKMLYSYMQFQPNAMVISAEDPVEQVIPGIIQRSLKDSDYATILKSILRHRPDIIVIGEIRDKEAADGMIRALLTGHKVICTLHIVEQGNVYQNIINRMSELGIDPTYLSTYLKAAVLMKEHYAYEILLFN